MRFVRDVYEAEVVVDAPVDAVAWWIPRTPGRLEPTDAGGTRLIGSTDDAYWYARQLSAIQASYRIVSSPELREAAGQLGRLLTRADSTG